VKRLVRVIPNTDLSGPMSIRAFPFVMSTLRQRARQHLVAALFEEELGALENRGQPQVNPPPSQTQTVASAK